MVQIIKEQPNEAGLALNNVLMYLAQNRLEKIQQNQKQTEQASAIQKYFGLSPDKALAAVQSGDPALKEIVRQQLQQPGNEATQRVLADILKRGQTPQEEGISGQQGGAINNESYNAPISVEGVPSKDFKSILNANFQQQAANEKRLSREQKEQHHIENLANPVFRQLASKASIIRENRI